MSKKIVVLNGGPRLKGNTAALVDSFAKGAQEAGHTVIRYDLQTMDIHGCKGCCMGGKDPHSPCTQKDDMDKIYPEYADADVVVFASPLYYWQITGQLKTAIDRLFAVSECKELNKKPAKEAVLVMAAGGDGWEETTYWYERLMGHMGWTDKGQILCPGVMAVGDVAGNPKLEEAYQLGKSL